MNEARHIPVLLNEVLAALQPTANDLILDGTFGAGGYTRAFLEKGARVIALDQDPEAIKMGDALLAEYPAKLQLHQLKFSQLEEVCIEAPSAVVLDIGVSSMQIDSAERGFSFQNDGPLDMRMAQQGPTAADVVNGLKANDLARIFYLFGEERHAGRIARMIDQQRQHRRFSTTRQLAQMIEKLIGRKPGDHLHPATRVFQALRIYVNNELGELADALFAAEAVLRVGGKLGVVTFHSLEDRMVKRFFAERSNQSAPSRYAPVYQGPQPSFDLLFKGVKVPTEQEVALNPRARSAKLRVGVRTGAATHKRDPGIFGLPELATFEGIGR